MLSNFIDIPTFILYKTDYIGGENKRQSLLATPNRNSSPTYRWATPFTRLWKANSFGGIR
ncbi:hypothetical protein CN558_16270 [Bacillus wiedmannii]|uniref:Uncharacterized protein n=1 Tax=Bacillus wiedmannii TaxID=1890302 RepID=A0A2B6UIB6_9BACI|nr:hypothetical protein CN690_05425 [Bacillus wiedmannii]PEM84693.1 hypothetical protein CN627_22240 [Bacillus wiedmannii]PEO84806.1 hypothetical protein CN558_16270 [Bacillus wiedmannii]PEP32455.1 hypothetical protein CN566_02145 [Bacillus wiedmannii]PFZ40151.1 hypothetical protein COL77_22025 [Bacillus wiedmannii]